MKPVNFDNQNSLIRSVPVNITHGQILSRWGMTWSERFSILWSGKLWLSIKGDTQPIILLSGNQSFQIENAAQQHVRANDFLHER